MSLKKGVWESCIEHASISDVGMRRESNQDAVAVSFTADLATWRQAGHLFIVADGMGAHAAGELASKLAADGVPHLFYKYAHLPVVDAITKSMRETNIEVHRRGQANLEFNNMGTTASVLVLSAQGAVIGHIGDSRVYRLRGRTIEQWTCDHSLVWDLRRSGHLTKEQERLNSIPKNVITRSIGPYPEVDPDIEGPLPIQVGDTFLLCTDGLMARVTDEEIGAILAHFTPSVATQLLVDLANMRGGPDNTSIIVVTVRNDRVATAITEQAAKRSTEEASSGPVAHPVSAQRRSAPERTGSRLPMVWLTACVLALASIVCLIIQQHLFAAIVAVASLVAAIWGFATRLAKASSRGQPELHSGQGPYLTLTVADARRAELMLRDALAQIRGLARLNGWEEDRESLDDMEKSAAIAARNSATRDALDLRYGLARELAERLRIHHARRSADTATGL